MEISNAAKRSSWSMDGLSPRFVKSQAFSGPIVGNSRQSPNHVKKQFLVDVSLLLRVSAAHTLLERGAIDQLLEN